ncbi:uncharacterized protein LOC114187060 [Vigna unguiculata]|uniref:uncharacterized protein LOC114187060 n=1 Tax=Vigna unguiculata TaxID=3917 RepID=UPI0010170E94|nr:uncharacterized protein LOC114187060 [Vigna unguiculata]
MEQAQKKEPVHVYHDDVLDVVGSFSSSSSDSSTSSSVSEISSGLSSLECDSFEEVTSSPSSSSADHHHQQQLVVVPDPFSDMSSLFQQLPIKRGLSKFYEGKSQSFTSLTNVRSLEDLAKAENPYNKRLKSCKSYGGGLAEKEGVSMAVSKRGMMHSAGSRASCSSLNARKGSVTNFIGSRPPIPPHRSTTANTIPNQTVLFA